MAVYLKPGEGRCPKDATRVTTISLSSSEISRIKKLYGAHANITEQLISEVVDTVVGKLPNAIQLIDYFVSVPKSKIITHVTDYITGNVRNISADIASKNKKTDFKCTITCVNHGQQGHYWTISRFHSV